MVHKYLLFFLLFISNYSFSQQLSGKITDKQTKDPLPYVTVAFYTIEGDLIKGEITDQNGVYKIDLKEGNYNLQITSIGYQTIKTHVSIKKDMRMDFELEIISELLDEVIIKDEKTTVNQLLDKKVINVGQDIMSSGGDAIAVLNQLSEIQVDEKGKIALRGNESVDVLVNGKLSPLSTNELLRQIPSNQIQKIEVITSPSAKYQASGVSGIINILTDRKIDNGFNLNLNSGVNSMEGYNLGSNFSYGTGKINYKFGASHTTPRYNDIESDKRFGILPYWQESSLDWRGEVKDINFGIDWFANSNNEFSVGVQYTLNEHTSDWAFKNMEEGVSSWSENLNNGFHSHKTLNYNLNYRHHFSKGAFLEVDGRYSDNSNYLKSDFESEFGIANSRADNLAKIYDIQFDYTLPISEKIKLELGYAWNRQLMNNHSYLVDDNNTFYEHNLFESQQDNMAIYAMSKMKLSLWNFQAGIRIEDFDRDIDLLSDNQNLKTKLTNIFPSIHLNKTFENSNTINFGFSRRIKRPSLKQMNPVTTQSQKYVLHQGNPSLQPEFSNTLEASYFFEKGILSITPTFYFSFKEDVISRAYQLQDNSVTIFTFENLGNSNLAGLDLTAEIKSAKWLKSNLSFSYNFEQLNQKNNEYINTKIENFSLRLKNQFKISSKLNFQISWIYNGLRKEYYGNSAANQKIDFGLRYKLLNGKGNLNFRVSDVFNTRRVFLTTIGEGFKREFWFKPQTRVAFLSFTYRFNKGKTPKKRSKKNYKYDSGVID